MAMGLVELVGLRGRETALGPVRPEAWWREGGVELGVGME